MATEVVLTGNAGDTTNSIIDLTGNSEKPDVVDLTGGPSHLQTEVETPEVKDDNVDAGKDGKEPAPKLDDQGNPITEPEGDKKDETTADEQPEFFFGEQQVEVEVPAEISAQLAEAGVDEKVLLGELFAKDGKFELSADTRAKLEAKFGKVMVDGYLTMYKGLNSQVIADHARTTKDADAAKTAMQAEYSELVGGEEGLNKLESYIIANFDEKQIASYNAVMSGDNWEAQKMVMSMARQQMAQHDKLTNGDRTIKLLGDGDENTQGGGTDDLTGKSVLTAAEYQQIMNGSKYWEDRAYQVQVDSLRSAGLRAGR